MCDRDLCNDFKSILEQYKQSPFGFRLRKSGLSLKLTEHNGLLYIDNDNLFKVLLELIGPGIPDDMREYINDITFSEIISTDGHNGRTSKMTCVQFVDHSFFEKCLEKLRAKRNELYHNDMSGSYLFSSLSPDIETASNIFSDDYKEKEVGIDQMFPFRSLWRFDTQDSTPTNVKKGGGRPRGKQMMLSKDSLKDRPYVCDVPLCDRAFKRYEHLKRHMKMHTGDKPFECSFSGCNKTFSRSDNLAQHMRTHDIGHRQKEKIFFGNDNSNSKTL